MKYLLIGIITTLIRIGGQLLIPVGPPSILEPSLFAKTNTMPVAFTIYGIIAYTVLAKLFDLIKDQIGGHRIKQGLLYGLSLTLIWTIYLWEPLPHVNALDVITYPLADGMALMVMGLLLGLLVAKTKESRPVKWSNQNWKIIISITTYFVLGRLFQYLVIDIYSSYDSKTFETIIWATMTGIVVSLVMIWYSHYIQPRVSKIISLLMLFGINLFLFNFFMPLVFDNDIIDLLLRTFIDVFVVIIAIYINKKEDLLYESNT